MGKIKGKIVKGGDNGCLKVKQDDGSWIQYDYSQPYAAQLGIVEGAVATCDLVPVDGKTMVAVSVNPIDKGEIVDIDYDNNSGTIFEKESGIKYTFTQDYLKQSGFVKGDMVKYTLTNQQSAMVATCLVKPITATAAGA